MPHDMPLITTLVGGLGLAFVFGMIATRFKVSPLVGYLVAGVAVGPRQSENARYALADPAAVQQWLAG